MACRIFLPGLQPKLTAGVLFLRSWRVCFVKAWVHHPGRSCSWLAFVADSKFSIPYSRLSKKGFSIRAHLRRGRMGGRKPAKFRFIVAPLSIPSQREGFL